MYNNILLFESQYSSFKGIIDYKTTNLSFIKLFYILKKMNISNRYFFLYLRDSSLQGVDPFSNKLTQDEKIKIGLECKTNPWYFFREIIRIPVSGAQSGIQFILNRANLAALWCFFNYLDVMITIPRQRGKTVSITAVLSYIMFIYGNYINIAAFAKDDPLRVENVQRLREIRDYLPGYLIYKKAKSKDNINSIEYDPLNNKYKSYVAQANKIAAEKIGRGSAVPVILIDETTIFENINITYSSIINAMATAAKNAKIANQPTGIFVTTTAGNKDIPAGKFSYNLMASSYAFNETLYDIKDHATLSKIIKKSSLAEMVYIEYSFFQLGGTQDEFETLLAKSKREGSDINQILRDLFNIWTSGGEEDSILTSEKTIQLKKGSRDPSYIEYIDDYTFNWYIDKKQKESSWFKEIPIILSTDPSENIGEDFTSNVFLNGLDGSVLGTMRINETNIVRLATLYTKLLVKYDNLLFMIERNSTGCSIIDIIIDKLLALSINPTTKLFNLIIQENESTIYSNDELANSKHRKKFGFKTTGSKSIGRTFLFKTVLMKALDIFSNKLYDTTLINEILGLKKNIRGRIDHKPGEHDDMVFAYMLGLYVLFYGKHLHKYSFMKKSPYELLEHLSIDEKSNISENVILQKEVVSKIKHLSDNINSMQLNDENHILKIKNKQKINKLTSLLPVDSQIYIDSNETVRAENNKSINNKYKSQVEINLRNFIL